MKYSRCKIGKEIEDAMRAFEKQDIESPVRETEAGYQADEKLFALIEHLRDCEVCNGFIRHYKSDDAIKGEENGI